MIVAWLLAVLPRWMPLENKEHVLKGDTVTLCFKGPPQSSGDSFTLNMLCLRIVGKIPFPGMILKSMCAHTGVRQPHM